MSNSLAELTSTATDEDFDAAMDTVLQQLAGVNALLANR